MNKAVKKLNSKSGASILIAMFFFIFCLGVGAMVLTGAVTASGKLATMQKYEQNYLAVSSAARLIKDGIDESGFAIEETTYDTYTVKSYKCTPSFGILNSELGGLAESRLSRNEGSSAAREILIQADGMPDVKGSVSMSENAYISIELWIEAPGSVKTNCISMVILPNNSEPSAETVDVVHTEDLVGGKKIIHETRTTVTTWRWSAGGCHISK